jgi:hypothetical protein
MRCNCPYCAADVVQDRNVGSLNYCTNCQKLFLAPPPKQVPPWILGALVVLVINWQILCRL